MWTTILFAYGSLSLAFWLHATVWMAWDGRGRHARVGAAERVLLAATGVAGSLAWPLLLPFYAAGWLRSGAGRRQMERMRLSGEEPAGEALPSGC